MDFLKKNFSLVLFLIYCVISLFFLNFQDKSITKFLRTSVYFSFYFWFFQSQEYLQNLDFLPIKMQNYIKLRKENEILKSQLSKYVTNALVAKSIEEENLRYRKIFDFAQKTPKDFIVADVTIRSPKNNFESFIINKGKKHGIKADMTVVALSDNYNAIFLIGKIADVFYDKANVMLISNINSNVSVYCKENKIEGVLKGKNSPVLILDYVLPDSNIQIGQQITTSGLGGIFPEGIPIGYITSTDKESDEDFYTCKVKPFLRLEKIREVLVLK